MDFTALQGRLEHFARADLHLVVHGIPVGFERLLVDLAQDLALAEAKRGDLDRRVITRPAGARQESEHRQGRPNDAAADHHPHGYLPSSATNRPQWGRSLSQPSWSPT